MKTIVIGIDAATWSVMMPLLETGSLPNLSSLMRNGTWGTLRSTILPMTPPAWTSIATGVNPGKHGIYDFVVQDQNTYRINPVNYSRMECPTIWDLFNIYDKKIGVVNFPLSFPPNQDASFFISGFGSPEGATFAYPPELIPYLKAKDYRIHPRIRPTKNGNKYFCEVKNLTDIQAEITLKLLKEMKWDLLWVIFQGLDWIQHFLWDSKHGTENAVSAFYKYMDSIIGQFVSEAKGDWNIVILSDHGFREVEAEIHINRVLEEWGYLMRVETNSIRKVGKIWDLALNTGLSIGRKLRFSTKSQIKEYIPKMLRSIFLRQRKEQLRLHKMIDWTHTKAFSFGYMGRIYIHDQHRYPNGCVEPGNEYFQLREEIIEKLKTLEHPDTGMPLVGEIFRKEDVYTGNKLRFAPDILFHPTDFGYSFFGDFGKSWFCRAQHRLADHDMEGIFILNGKYIRQGIEINANVVDIAPTLLYLHDLPVSYEMDGRVLEKALVEDLIADRQIQFADSPAQTKITEYSLSETERILFEDRLRDLGYL